MSKEKRERERERVKHRDGEKNRETFLQYQRYMVIIDKILLVIAVFCFALEMTTAGADVVVSG